MNRFSSKYKYLLLAMAAPVLMTACSKDFLNIKPEQGTEIQDAIVDLPTMRAAVSGTYNYLQNESYYGRTYSIIPELMSDNAFISVLNSGRYRSQDQYVVIATESTTSDGWNQLYRVVANSCLLIEKGPGIKLTETSKDTVEARQLLGEAYSLRALAYFDLCRLYAQPYNATTNADHFGVPIVTTIDPDKPQFPARSTVKQNYDLIIADLTKALELLPASVGTKGRFNLHAARALLCRVMLYKEDWIATTAAATEVITKGGYTLLDNTQVVTGFKTNGNTETILEVVNTPTDNRGTNSLVYMYAQGGYGDAIATADLYNAYTATDARRAFITRGRRTGSGGENPGYIINKYQDINNFSENLKLIRLAEVYLNRAEALARQGRDADAQKDLNLIVKRADPTAPNITLTGNDLLKAIWNERRKELAFEGFRLFDLNRTKQSFTKFFSGNSNLAITYPNDKVIAPIPQRELDANPNIRGQQNKGY